MAGPVVIDRIGGVVRRQAVLAVLAFVVAGVSASIIDVLLGQANRAFTARIDVGELKADTNGAAAIALTVQLVPGLALFLAGETADNRAGIAVDFRRLGGVTSGADVVRARIAGDRFLIDLVSSRRLAGVASQSGGVGNDAAYLDYLALRTQLDTLSRRLDAAGETAQTQAEVGTIGVLLVCATLIAMVGAAFQRERARSAQLTVELDRDPLTGLLNHRAFTQRLVIEAANAASTGRDLGLVLVDVDFFKRVNDTHGHPAGDRVLQRVAACLSEAARFGDHLARIGGDEFAWLLPGADPEATVAAADYVRSTISAEMVDAAPVTVSVGACTLTVAGAPEALYELADAALYRAKAQGRDTVAHHTAA